MQEGSLDLQRYKFITVYSSYNLLYKKNIKLGDIAFDTIRFAMLAQLLLYSYGGDTNMHWTAAFINYKYIITSLKFSTISSTIIIRWGSITETVHPIEVRYFYLFWIVLRLKILRLLLLGTFTIRGHFSCASLVEQYNTMDLGKMAIL